MSAEQLRRKYKVNDVVGVISKYLDMKVPVTPLVEINKFQINRAVNTITQIISPKSGRHERFFGSYGLLYIMDKNGTPIILLNRERNRDITFNLPGGTRKNDETPEQTFVREIAEEMGLQVEPKDFDHIGEV